MPKQFMTEREAIDYLKSQQAGCLATVDAAGNPYITPLNYVYIHDKLYFHCARKGKKLDNITVHPQVSFAVSQSNNLVFQEESCKSSNRYTSVIVSGRAKVIQDISRQREVLEALMVTFAKGRIFKHITDEMASTCVVVEIEIGEISGKCNVDPR